jgi:hypothetical protein
MSWLANYRGFLICSVEFSTSLSCSEVGKRTVIPSEVNIIYPGITMSNYLKPELLVHLVYIINVCSNVRCPESWSKIFEFSYILKEIIDALSKGVEPAGVSRLPGTDVSLFLFKKLIR